MRTDNQTAADVAREAHLSPVDWSSRVDALACGSCSEEDFVAELRLHGAAAPDLPWHVAALLDQRFRNGLLRADIFRSTAANIARRQLTSERKPPLTLVETASVHTATIPTAPTGETFQRPQLRVGHVLRDRYVIDGCLGTGGMGIVYKAVDRFRQEHGEIDCHVAIKVLHEGSRDRSAALARLRCEFYCAQMLSHPNVVNVFDLDRDGDLDFFTMEWLDGELLSTVLHKFAGRPMPRIAAWAIIRQIAEGIVHAHERNIVHADLKPQNIMILKSGQVRILDFGASSGGPHGAVADTERPQRSLSALTPAYASCELLTGKRPDPRDDLYALSCLTCELLAGQHPFWHQRSTAARMAQAIPSRPPHLADRQWRVLMQGLAWDREHRSISVRDWLATLNPQAVSLHSIPAPQQLGAAATAAVPAKLSAARIMAALGVFLACLSAWALFNRPSRMGMTATAQGVPAISRTAAAASMAPAANAAGDASPGDAGSAADSSADAGAAPAGGSLAGVMQSGARPVSAGTRRGGRGVDVVAASYRVMPGSNFAEVRVRRTSAADRSSFEWWTEESTALSGVDYVPQLPATVTFKRGSHTASLFVKLLTDSARKQTAKFDVVIGGASKGALVGLSRAQIVLVPGASATPIT